MSSGFFVGLRVWAWEGRSSWLESQKRQIFEGEGEGEGEALGGKAVREIEWEIVKTRRREKKGWQWSNKKGGEKMGL